MKRSEQAGPAAAAVWVVVVAAWAVAVWEWAWDAGATARMASTLLLPNGLLARRLEKMSWRTCGNRLTN
jgi:hypothetical protein